MTKKVTQGIEKYEFGPALHDIYDFFWHSFCDKYLESAKIQLADAKKPVYTKQILFYVLTESLKLLHPFMPFVTEEIWGYLPRNPALSKKGGASKKLLLIEKWPR